MNFLSHVYIFPFQKVQSSYYYVDKPNTIQALQDPYTRYLRNTSEMLSEWTFWNRAVDNIYI